jgi:hypothetical protein
MSTNLILTAVAGGATFMLAPKETRVRDALIAVGISYAAGSILMREPQPTDLMPSPNPEEVNQNNPTVPAVEQNISLNVGPTPTFSVPATTIAPSTPVPPINQVILSNPSISDAPSGPMPDRIVSSVTGPIESSVLDPTPAIQISGPPASIAPDTESKQSVFWQSILNPTAPVDTPTPNVSPVNPWNDRAHILPIRRPPDLGRLVRPNPASSTVPSISNAAQF